MCYCSPGAQRELQLRQLLHHPHHVVTPLMWMTAALTTAAKRMQTATYMWRNAKCIVKYWDNTNVLSISHFEDIFTSRQYSFHFIIFLCVFGSFGFIENWSFETCNLLQVWLRKFQNIFKNNGYHDYRKWYQDWNINSSESESIKGYLESYMEVEVIITVVRSYKGYML